MNGLSETYARILELTDPVRHISREAARIGAACDQLNEATLSSGAFLGDFKIMLMIDNRRLRPVLG